MMLKVLEYVIAAFLVIFLVCVSLLMVRGTLAVLGVWP